jgi:hypothetical protein
LLLEVGRHDDLEGLGWAARVRRVRQGVRQPDASIY